MVKGENVMRRLKEYQWVVALFILLVFGTVLIFTKKEQLSSNTPSVKQDEMSETATLGNDIDKRTNETPEVSEEVVMSEPSSSDIYVDVKGEVYQPGVYRVTEDMRIIDVIEDAGGFSKDADINQVNLAMKVSDEMIIYVPNKHDVEAGEKLDHYSDQKHDKIKINQATLEELVTLPGIGEKKAEAILTYIELNGPFKTTDELTNVDGIGDKTVASLLEKIQIP